MLDVDKLSDELGKVRNSLSTFKATASFQDVAEKVNFADENPFEKVDQPPGSVVDGIKALQQQTDNLADELESKLKPMITKIDKSIREVAPEIETTISEADLTDIDKMFTSSLVVAADMFEQAQPALETLTDVLEEVIEDGSLQATMVTMTNTLNQSIESVTGKFENFTPEDFSGIVSELVEDVNSEKVQKEFQQATEILNASLDAAVGNFKSSGGLMKELSENLSNTIGGTIEGLELPGVNVKALQGQVLSGRIGQVRDTLTSKVGIPESLQSISTEYSGPSGFTDLKTMKSFLTEASNKLKTATQSVDLERVKGEVDKIITNVKPELGNLSGVVSSTPENAAQNANPIANFSIVKNKPYQIMNSTEEIVKYLQSSSRYITTVVIGWTGLTLDYSNLTAEEYANGLRAKYPNSDTENGLAHFFIRKDGTIETSRPIDKYRGYISEDPDLRISELSIYLQFNAGKNCYKDKYPNGSVPLNELSSKSITTEQMKAFNTWLQAWFTFSPHADTYGARDLDYKNRGIVAPGFDVKEYVWSKFNKTGTGFPEIEKKFLAKEDMSFRNKEKTDVKLREIRDDG